MIERTDTDTVPLEGSSPFELRTDLSKNVPESVVKKALETGDTGFLHSFTTGSAVDGPGIRLVAWTAGCQFRCVYCHNPDTWNMMNGMAVPLDRAVAELNKYRHGLKIMAGGFTLSGGEPLMQDRFAARLMSAAKEMGIHTALDTNGYLGERLSDEELEQIDLVLLDIKSWDPERHKHLVGKDIGPVLDFARRLAQRRRPIWLRYVLVPDLTDDEGDINHLAGFVAGLGNVERVDVLPFHQMGRYKWEKLGLNYALKDAQSPAPEVVKRVCEQFRSAGLKAY
ncbi:MAG TPA: pyruvate formate-lyase-activating protein [Pyrinomonadaceae bacterium]|jgi:pyruvate formate lyase activating enzyme|nr:pyruvate formate-lyase-activating protein [Pyrinomonadaceae bacterium]